MGDLITYDGNNPFEGQVDPLVSQSTDYLQAGDRWGTLDAITLNGTLTGANFADLYNAQTGLLGDFSQDFKTLEISEFDDFEKCKVNNISFGETDYLSFINYTINISRFGNEDGLLKTYGIIDPVSNISYSDQEDGKVSATRNVSAKGISTPDKPDALDNAFDFVSALAGQRRPDGSSPGDLNWVAVPEFAAQDSKNPNGPMTLKSQKQNINRFTCEVSLVEEYSMDPTSTDDCMILKYSETISVNAEGEEATTVEGSIESSPTCEDVTMADVLTRYNEFRGTYGTNVSEETFTQDIENKKVSWSFVFSGSDNTPDVDIDVQLSVSEGESSDYITVTVNGVISAKKSQATNAFARVNQVYQDLNFFDEAVELYNEYLEQNPRWQVDTELSDIPVSTSSSKSEQNASISFTQTYNDRFDSIFELRPGTSCESSPSSFSVSAQPQIEQISIIPSINGDIQFVNGHTSLAGVTFTQTSPRALNGNDIISLKQMFDLDQVTADDITSTQSSRSTIPNDAGAKAIIDSTSFEFKSSKSVTDHEDDGKYKWYKASIDISN